MSSIVALEEALIRSRLRKFHKALYKVYFLVRQAHFNYHVICSQKECIASGDLLISMEKKRSDILKRHIEITERGIPRLPQYPDETEFNSDLSNQLYSFNFLAREVGALRKLKRAQKMSKDSAHLDKEIVLRKREAMKLMIFNIGLENELLKLYIKTAVELDTLNENEAEINDVM